MKGVLFILSLTFVLSGCSTTGVMPAGSSETAKIYKSDAPGWADGKAVREINAPISKVVQAVILAFEALKLNITKTDIAQNTALIIGEYLDSRTIWIDLHSISERSTHLEVRVSVQGNKEASYRIIEEIQSFLEKN